MNDHIYLDFAKAYWGSGWSEKLSHHLQNPHFKEIIKKAKKVHREGNLCPPLPDVFRAFRLTSFWEVKVVIVGQDPYHTPGVADGLSFSSRNPNYTPPSLRNVFVQIEEDCGCKPQSVDLTSWAEQGVLLLNRFLTTEVGKAKAHRKWGWQYFTSQVVKELTLERENVVFLLWGRVAQEVKQDVNYPHWNPVLESGHPSPLSCSYFFGNQHFKKTNEFLHNKGLEPIKWC